MPLFGGISCRIWQYAFMPSAQIVSKNSSKLLKKLLSGRVDFKMFARPLHTTLPPVEGQTTDINDDIELRELELDATTRKLGTSHKVFVIQPHIVGSSRPELTKSTTPELQLAESVALVNCLPGWTVTGELIVMTRTPLDVAIFTQTRMNALCGALAEVMDISAIFISLDRINGLQKKYLVEKTGIENIFDRYTLVLEIFRLRAQTKAAKLQVALAEIPYLKSNLKADITSINRQGKGHCFNEDKLAFCGPTYVKTASLPYVFCSHVRLFAEAGSVRYNAIGGPGETPLELLLRQFRRKEQKIKQRLATLSQKRAERRDARRRGRVPIVAVVGYTNAGKTTLIKALTGSEKLQPRNLLFATLDVTSHAAVTSGELNYILVDTVGFISDIPHSLVDAFSSTMEDMLQADVIIHVCDVSHPDCKNQRKNVHKALRDLNIPEHLLDNMIEVHNKIDLLHGSSPIKMCDSPERSRIPKTTKKKRKNLAEVNPAEVCAVCATEGVGIPNLRDIIHGRVVSITGSGNLRVRIPADGDYFDWFHKYATVVGMEADGDYHFIVDVTISKAMLDKFKSTYSKYRILM